jgi:hypothetical protein
VNKISSGSNEKGQILKPNPVITVCQDPSRPNEECEPARILMRLVDEGWFLVNEDDRHDCHDVSMRLLAALGESGNASNGWYFVQGWLGGEVLHSWLEYKGYVIDCSNGRTIVFPVSIYYGRKSLTGVRRYTPPQLIKKLQSKKGRKQLGWVDDHDEMDTYARNLSEGIAFGQ